MSSSNRSNVHFFVHIQFLFRNGYYSNFAADLIWTNNKMKTKIQPQDSNRAEAFRFQFHHVQMDGGQGARFLDELQKNINAL